jgi:hypothetical protein
LIIAIAREFFTLVQKKVIGGVLNLMIKLNYVLMLKKIVKEDKIVLIIKINNISVIFKILEIIYVK